MHNKELLAITLLMYICAWGTDFVQKERNAWEVIKQAGALATSDAQVKYLLKEARSFVNKKDFQQAEEVADHILARLDRRSPEAQEIMLQSRYELSRSGG